jgi:hypothetical protein
MDFILFLIKLIMDLFRKPSLPHPEEPQDKNKTLANTSIDEVFKTWFTRWAVPVANWDYWYQAIDIHVQDGWTLEQIGMLPYGYKTPAYTYEADGIRHFYCLATWWTPGVVAHEQAHNSYALLTEAQKDQYEIAYQQCQNDPYIKLLHSQNTYMNALDAHSRHVEAHAEVYRFLGQQVPEELKRFYPKLF